MSGIKRGVTLVEVLIGIALLGSVGVMLSGFLSPNRMSQKAFTEDFGRRLSEHVLLRVWMARNVNDTVIDFRDSLGVAWSTQIHVVHDGAEQCAQATSVRAQREVTRTLVFCLYE